MKGIVAPRRWAVNDAQLDAAGTRRMKRASTVLLTLRHRRQLTVMRCHRPTRRLHTPAETKIKAVLSMLQVAVLMASSSPSAYRGSSETPTSLRLPTLRRATDRHRAVARRASLHAFFTPSVTLRPHPIAICTSADRPVRTSTTPRCSADVIRHCADSHWRIPFHTPSSLSSPRHRPVTVSFAST